MGDRGGEAPPFVQNHQALADVKCFGLPLLMQADAFISLHGSGEMNSMFMRRDSIKIQMRQKDFGTMHR